MSLNPLYRLLAAVLMLCLPAALAAKTATETVDCTDPDPRKHDSINKALQNKADALIIEVAGFCREQVIIARNGVTLMGSDPATDGINGPVPSDPAVERALVQIVDSFDVRLENLTVTGGERPGLEGRGSGITRIVNCRVVNNGGRGIQAVESHAFVVRDTTIANNGSVELIVFHADIFCTRCTVSGSGTAAAAVRSGLISLDDSTVSSGGLYSIISTQEATISGHETGVIAADVSLYASENAQVYWSDEEVSGSMVAESASQIFLRNVSQTANPFGNVATDDSHFKIEGGSLLGDTLFTGFSDGTVEGSAAVDTLSCDRGGNLFCDGTETKNSSSGCGLCP